MKASTASSAIFEAVRIANSDPIWFRKHVLRLTNDPWQDEILQAFADIFRLQRNEPTVVNHEGLRRFSVRSGHGPGKTTCVAQIMHYCGFIRRAQIICTATKFKQVTSRLWPTFRVILQGAIDEYQELISTRQHKIIWANDQNWYATPETATQPENLQGYHPLSPSDFLLFNIDEASGVKQELFPVIMGTLSKPNAALFMIGNPTQNQGEFYESHNKPAVKKFCYARHILPEESSHMDKKWYEEGRERYGENSPIFKVRYRGEFAENAENQLIPIGWIMRALERDEVNDGSFPRLRIMVDVADGGVDETVVMAARRWDSNSHVLSERRYSFPPAESPVMAAEKAVEMFKAFKGDKDRDDFVVDSLGVGSGTAGILLKDGYRVVLYKGGESSSNPNKWRNKRVQSYLCLRDALRDGHVSFAEDFVEREQDKDDLIAQLCWIKVKPGAERVEDLETKQELIQASGKSPDLADTLAMLYATEQPKLLGASIEHSVAAVGTLESAQADW